MTQKLSAWKLKHLREEIIAPLKDGFEPDKADVREYIKLENRRMPKIIADYICRKIDFVAKRGAPPKLHFQDWWLISGLDQRHAMLKAELESEGVKAPSAAAFASLVDGFGISEAKLRKALTQSRRIRKARNKSRI